MIRAIGALVLLGVLVALATAAPDSWSLDPDAAAYVRLGRSIAETGTYALDGVPHGKYPPGLPLIVAALTDVPQQTSYAPIHVALVLLLGVGAVASWGVARRLELGDAALVAIVVASTLSQTFFDLTVQWIRTEVPFFALSTAALWALLACLDARSEDGRRPNATALLAAVLMVAAIATRLAGVTLAAVPAWALVRPGASRGTRLRALLLGLVAVAALGAWQARGDAIAAEFPQAVDYGGELMAAEPRDLTKVNRLDNPRIDGAAMTSRVVGNAEVFARACATLLTNVDRAAARLPVGLLLLGVVVLGLARLLGPRSTDARRTVALYVVGTVGLYLVWPFNQQERFYAPLLPWLLLAAGEGLALAWTWARAASSARVMRVAIVALAAAVWAVLALQRSQNAVWLGRYSSAYAALLVVTLLGVVGLGVLLRRGPLPPLRAWTALLVVVLFAVPWTNRRLREWPAVVAVYAAEQQTTERFGPVFVHPVLRDMAALIVEHTGPDDVVMTDVPKMLTILTDRRCVPFTYRLDPPDIELGDASAVYYTGELLEAIDLLDALVAQPDGALAFERLGGLEAMPGPMQPDGTLRMVAPTLYRVTQR